MITRDAVKHWKDHPVTLHFLHELGVERQEMLESILTTPDVDISKGRVQGMDMVLGIIRNLEEVNDDN